jgi:hypothetical protein
MGCVRGARDELTHSSRGFGQKSEKWHLSRDESTDSVQGPGHVAKSSFHVAHDPVHLGHKIAGYRVNLLQPCRFLAIG